MTSTLPFFALWRSLHVNFTPSILHTRQCGSILFRIMRKFVVFPLVVCVLLFATVAFADSITSVSPASFTRGDIEQTVSINGTGLKGIVSTTVVFSGPAGTFSTDATPPTDTNILVSVPDVVLSQAGTVSVSVQANDGPSTRTI